jgi:uncharacterized protein
MDAEKVEIIATGLLLKSLSPDLYYHNLVHTKNVVSAALELAASEGITNEADLTFLLTAAWFHDVGYVVGYEHHERESCKMARELLPQAGFNKQQIDIVCKLIMKTHVPQEPETILEKILCDADLDYLGQPEFTRLGKDLFKEWQAKGRVNDEQEFNLLQINFLQKHKYWTLTSQRLREPVKQQHLQTLKMLCEL